ncbi:MAG: hypothetical protein HC906_00200 [Bacteroidales bacterium]|nr:hypothetical protein [Bacteroidales bacterium]
MFRNTGLPVIQTSCGISGCHDAGTAEEGVTLRSYDDVIKLVTPGKPHESELYTVITNVNGTEFMPPDNPLTLEQRTIIRLWIAQGAKNEECSTNPIDTSPNNPPIVPVDTITFVQDILPILQSSCGTTGCHDAITQEEDYDFTSYSALMNSETVEPFRPSNSKLYRVITDNEDDDRMPPPPSSPLSSQQIQQIQKWISDGALNSSYVSEECDTSGTIGFTASVLPIINSYCKGLPQRQCPEWKY